MLPAGLGMCACTFIYMYIWVYTGEVNAKRLREKYLQAILRQDVAFFDNVGAGEVATRIQTDTREFQRSHLSDRPSISSPFRSCSARNVRKGCFGGQLPCCVCLRFCPGVHSMLAFGFGDDFHPPLYCDRWWCHEQAGVRIHAVCNLLFLNVITRLTYCYSRLALKYVAEGGTIAEEVISTVRTAQAFGTQSVLAGLYNSRVEEAQKVDLKAAVVHGGGLSVFFFVIYAAYALGNCYCRLFAVYY